MKDSILFTEEDVDFVRSTLTALHVYLHSQDMADSQRRMVQTRPSPLTKEVAECLEMVEDVHSKYLLGLRDQAASDA